MGYLHFHIFNVKQGKALTLLWFLREPVVHAARIDVSIEATPRLMAALCQARAVVLRHIMTAAGTELTGYGFSVRYPLSPVS